MKYIHNKADVPKEPHFAIIEFTSVWIPGDERSRTNPGHGYPEHTDNYCHYIVFESEGEWKNEIEKRMTPISYGRVDNWIAVRVSPATISTQFTVNVERPRII